MVSKIYRHSNIRVLTPSRFSGNATISSATTSKTAKNSSPAKARVFLYEATSMKLIGTTISDSFGDWSFQNLDPNRKYTLVVKDVDGILNGTTIDQVSAVVL